MEELLSKKLADLKFCALDLETTGINPALCKILEVGLIAFSLKGETARFSSLCNPEEPIPACVISVHGIRDSHVSDAPLFCDIVSELLALIGDSIIVGHNPGFDLAFLKAAMGEAYPRFEALDTIRLARRAFPNAPGYRLEALCGYLGIELSPHRALADAAGCMEVFKLSLKELDLDGMFTLNDLLLVHGRPVSARENISTTPLSGFMGMRVGRKIKIRYESSDGRITEREIIPEKFMGYGKRQYVIAYCLLRCDIRYFKASRIISTSKA